MARQYVFRIRKLVDADVVGRFAKLQNENVFLFGQDGNEVREQSGRGTQHALFHAAAVNDDRRIRFQLLSS
jgi:hypothetical protein